MTAREVFEQSDAGVTKAYYAELQKRGPVGVIATNLMRCQKASTRAKLYRGRRFKSSAYDNKNWALGNLCIALENYRAGGGEIAYGWKQDPTVKFGEADSWVFYVALPQGQISFHSPVRMTGPAYDGDWDGQHASEERILAFCDAVMAGTVVLVNPITKAPTDFEPWPSHPKIFAGQHQNVALRFGDPDSIAMARGGRRR